MDPSALAAPGGSEAVEPSGPTALEGAPAAPLPIAPDVGGSGGSAGPRGDAGPTDTELTETTDAGAPRLEASDPRIAPGGDQQPSPEPPPSPTPEPPPESAPEPPPSQSPVDPEEPPPSQSPVDPEEPPPSQSPVIPADPPSACPSASAIALAASSDDSDLGALSEELADASALECAALTGAYLLQHDGQRGALVLQPDPNVPLNGHYGSHSGPLRGWRIRGDFIAETCVEVTRASDRSLASEGPYTTGGLAARAPGASLSGPESVTYTTGFQHRGQGRAVSETENRRSLLLLNEESVDASPPTTRRYLRLCRVGSSFLFLHRESESQSWTPEMFDTRTIGVIFEQGTDGLYQTERVPTQTLQALHSLEASHRLIDEALADGPGDPRDANPGQPILRSRPRLPPELEVGIVVNSWNGSTDVAATFDYVRFGRVSRLEDCAAPLP